jgi:hypothetical protein
VEQIKQLYNRTGHGGHRPEYTFSGRETHLPDIEIGGYYWDFGDGQRAGRN